MVDKLLSEGHHVVCVDNMSSENNNDFYWNSSANNYNIDICDRESVRRLFDGVDYVFHLNPARKPSPFRGWEELPLPP